MRRASLPLAGTMTVVLLSALGGLEGPNVAAAAEYEVPAGRVPASPAASRSWLASMATEEIEPGVYRLIDDGVRDLGAWRGTWGQDGGVTVGADGTVWIHEANGDYFRLGEEPTRGLPQAFRYVGNSPRDTFGPQALHAGPSGQLWAWDAQTGRVNRLVANEWQEQSDLAVEAMAVDGRGEAWAAGRRGLLHIDTDGETLIAWPLLPARDVAWHTLDVSAAGTAYLLAGPQEADAEGGFLDTLLRHDASGWSEIELPVPISVFFPGDGMGVGADGTVWVAGDDHGSSDYLHHRLARLDPTGWAVFTDADGVQPWGGKEGFVPEETLSVSADGSVWVDASSQAGGWAGCDGVARFDGRSWAPYLAGRCLVDIDFAPDGSAWVLADGDEAPVEAFVIVSCDG